MSITFSIPNKRGFLGFQKVLKISELLGFVDGLEPQPYTERVCVPWTR